MFKRQHAAAVLVTCVSLSLMGHGPSASAQDATAAELFEQGIALFESGDLVAAKQTLEKISDPIVLTKDQRQQLSAALDVLDNVEIPAAVETAVAEVAEEPEAAVAEAVEAPAPEAPAEPTPADVLAQADGLTETDPGTAIAIYTTLIEEGGDTGETAQARMADLLRSLNEDQTQAKKLLDSAEADIDAEQFDAAATKLAAITESGVEFDWLNQQRVDAAAAKIADAQAPVVAEAPAPAPTPAPRQAQPVQAAAPAPAATSSSRLLREAQKAVAADYVTEAKEAQANGYDALAITLLNKAEELDPNNPEIQTILAAANSGGAAGDRPQLDNEVDRFRIIRDSTEAAYNEAMDAARIKLEAGDYPGAANEVARAKTTLEGRQEFFSIREYDDMRADATALSVTIDEEERKQDIDNQIAAADKQAQDEAKALAEAKAQAKEEVRSLIKQARQFQREMKYDEALQLLDQALFKEPTNFTAELLKEVIEDAKISVDYKKALRLQRLNMAQQSISNREAVTPYQDIITYPEDWPELSDTRIRTQEDTSGDSAANRETLLKLKKPVPINFDANPLESVIDYIRQTTQANIFVNWSTLVEAGVEEDLPITLKLSNVPAEKALQLVLQQASAVTFGEIVSYSIIDGVVEISTAEDLKRSTDLRVYDIRDLLVQVPNFTDAPEFDLESALESSGDGGGGGSIFGDSDNDDEDEEESREQLILEIIELISETVGTLDDWESLDSSVKELNSNLIIKTTPDNHRQVQQLLAQLRETRAIQISVEARFLLVERNFLDELSVDFDVAWQGQDGPVDRIDPFTGDATNQGFQPITAAQGSNVLAGASENANSFETFFLNDPALSLGASFIDDLSVNFLVEATLANRNSISLTAPRITFFNGQRAYVTVARQFSFVSEVEAVPDSLGFDVTIDVTSSGVVLDVEGTISADRRYVTLTLRPSLADLVSIDEFDIGNNFPIFDDDGNLLAVIESDFSLQLPILDITSVRSTVSVPDRGTLLVGGQRLVGETEVESGVPVLSKIPLLNRLFTNNSTVEDERTLLILIKPTIIIQNEKEEEFFPGITDNLIEAAGQ